MTLQFGVLGPLAVWADGEQVPVQGAKRRALLAYLLVHAGEVRSLDRIVEELAAGGLQVSESTVQTYVSQLRKLLGSDGVGLEHRNGGYVLDLDPNALDAARFEASVATATALDDGDRRIALLDEALALWRDIPLVEFAGQDWADQPTRRWLRLHVLAQQLRASSLLDQGRHRDALPALEKLVASYPLHEPFWALLVVARYRCGQPADALAALAEARQVLVTELGVEPGPELVDLERKVLAHDASLDTPALTNSHDSAMRTVIQPLPTGVVSFMMTDIEGSTALWDQAPDEMSEVLARYEDLIAEIVEAHTGRVLKSRGEGDATLSVFDKATDAVMAAVALQRRLAEEARSAPLDLPTRIAVHTGQAELRNGDYYGGTLNRAARLRALASGRQILVSRAVHDVVAGGLAPDIGLVKIGDRALKGLQRQETVYAIVGSGLEVRPPLPNDAPLTPAATLFVGRSETARDVERALRQSRLVTLVGPGGIGKTRLALEIANEMYARERVAKALVAELAPVRDDGAVRSAMAAALGDSGEDLAGALTKLRGQTTLLVIDNCEQVVEESALVVADLLDSEPELFVLATSRVPLEVRGETVIRVEPLAQSDALRLLYDRVGRDVPPARSAEWTNACELVARADCIPLALELIGARLRSITAIDLLSRLRVLDTAAKRPSTARHATVRAAIDWSYDLLHPEERALLRRLSVFAGFTLEAAEHIVPSSESEVSEAGDVAELVEQLVLQSFVAFRADASRYRLLEPVREYAAELLERYDDVRAIRDRHAAYFCEVAERVGRALARGDQSQTELDDDEYNIEAALAWTDQERDDETFSRIVAALGVFWLSTNTQQGLRWTSRALARPRDVAPLLRAEVLVSAARLAPTSVVDPIADAAFDEAIAIYRDLKRTRRLAWALLWRGRMLGQREPARARPYLEESLTLFRDCGDLLGVSWALYALSMAAWELGNDELSRVLIAELHDLAEAQVPAALSLALSRSAFAALTAGDDADALRLIGAAEAHDREGNRSNLLGTLYNRSWIESQVGSRQRALEALREALELDRIIGPGDPRIPALLAAELLVDQQPAAAREVLASAGLLHGEFGPFPERWARERASKIAARLDLTEPATGRFQNFMDALDWILEWVSGELDDAMPEP